jgi:hypothetical protein
MSDELARGPRLKEASTWDLIVELKQRGWRMGHLDESRMPMAITHRDEQGMLERIFTETLYDEGSGCSFELMESQAYKLRSVIDYDHSTSKALYKLKEGVTWKDFQNALRKL